MTNKYLYKQILETRGIFEDLCEILSNTDWKRKCENKPFTIGEVMMQITSSLEFLPTVVKDIRRGKGFTPPPRIIIMLIRFFFMGFMGRDLTKGEVKTRYTRAHKQVLQLLETIAENEWQKKTKFFGRYETIEKVFLSYLQSFSEDIKRIEETLKNTKEKLALQNAS